MIIRKTGRVNHSKLFLILIFIFIPFILLSCIEKTTQEKIEYFYQMGLNEERSENYLKSLEYYNRVLELEPVNLNSLKRKSIVLTNLKRYKEAIACNDAILKAQPDTINIIFNNGVLYYKISDSKKSLKIFEELLKKNPADFKSSAFKGKIYYEQNKKKEGLALIKRVLAENPDKKEEILKLLELNLLIKPGECKAGEYTAGMFLKKYCTYTGYEARVLRIPDFFKYKTSFIIPVNYDRSKYLTSEERKLLNSKLHYQGEKKSSISTNSKYDNLSRDEIEKKLEEDENARGDQVKSINYLLQSKKNTPSGIYDVIVEYTINFSNSPGTKSEYGREIVFNEKIILKVNLNILVL
jgi:tetratricopeptide (TPR) repeat protein